MLTLDKMHTIVQNISGPTPKISEANTYLDINFEDIRIIINQNLTVEISIPINYRKTFDSTDAKWLSKQGITYWGIYKHYLKFNKEVSSNELQTFIEQILDKFS